MAFNVDNGYPIFTGVDGRPLDGGYIFIGEEFLNPLSNPQPAFWDEDLTIPATNIRTKGGYAVYEGSPARIYTKFKYSILVQDRNGNTVYFQPISVDPFEDMPVPKPGVGGIPLGAIFPENGVSFTGFLPLGSTGLDQSEYPELFASGVDLIVDNGDGTFNIRNSGGTTGWVANSTWAGANITVLHNLNVNMSDLDFEVFVSPLGTEASAIRIMDTSITVNPAANFTGGISAYGLNLSSFIVRTGDDGLDVIDSDGSRLTLTNQSWYYKISYRRKDMPFPAQIHSRTESSSLDGGDTSAANIAIQYRRGTASQWAADNPVLANGEPGFEENTGVLRIGNGTDNWLDLPEDFGLGAQWTVDNTVETGLDLAVVGSVVAWSPSLTGYVLDDRADSGIVTVGVVKSIKGTKVTIVTSGTVTGSLLGLTPGSAYYNSDTPGGYTSTTDSEARTIFLGVAVSATEMLVNVALNAGAIVNNDVFSADGTYTGNNNFTGALQKDGSDVLTAATGAGLASNQTISGDKNFTGALSLNGFPVTAKFGAETFQKILATDPDPGDYFGSSVAISGDYAIVGAWAEGEGGSNAGAAYIYWRTGLNTWGEGIKILATDPEANAHFGNSVAISGDYAIGGAWSENEGGSNSGAAYMVSVERKLVLGT